MITKKTAMSTYMFIMVCASPAYASMTITPNPLCEVFTPRELYAGTPLARCASSKRSRFSTCGGIAWFHDNKYLAVANFEGGFISTYAFDAAHHQCTPLQVFYGSQDDTLKSAELLAFSPDGSMLAVGVNRTKKIIIYAADKKTHVINPDPLLTIPHGEDCVHGVRFSHDNNYLACSTVHGERVINFYALSRQTNTVHAELTSTLKNAFLGLRPKSLDFTKDDRFVAVVYSEHSIKETSNAGGLIAIYAFDKTTGTISPPVVSIYKEDLFNGGEDIAFSTDDSSFIVSEQATDKVTFIAFDKTTGQIGKKLGSIQNPEAKLHLPHGISLSSDGKYLAVTNYGDDKFSIYQINEKELNA
jgi:6-phosphogluconolactonase (cycloisomerase 2 family)